MRSSPFEPTPGFSGAVDPSPLPASANLSPTQADDRTGGRDVDRDEPAKPSGWIERAEVALLREGLQARDAALRFGADMRERLVRTVGQGADALASMPFRMEPERFIPLAAGVLAVAAALASLPALLRRRVRVPLRLWLALRRTPMRRRDRANNLIGVLDAYWREIFRQYGGIREGETIREYVRSLPERNGPGFPREALTDFAMLYESVRYGSGSRWLPRHRLKEIGRGLFEAGRGKS